MPGILDYCGADTCLKFTNSFTDFASCLELNHVFFSYTIVHSSSLLYRARSCILVLSVLSARHWRPWATPRLWFLLFRHTLGHNNSFYIYICQFSVILIDHYLDRKRFWQTIFFTWSYFLYTVLQCLVRLYTNTGEKKFLFIVVDRIDCPITPNLCLKCLKAIWTLM